MKVKPWVGEAITIKHSRMLDFLLNVDGLRTINLFNLTFGSGQKSLNANFVGSPLYIFVLTKIKELLCEIFYGNIKIV